MTLWQIHRNGEPYGDPWDSQAAAVGTLRIWKADQPDADWTIEPVAEEDQGITAEQARSLVIQGLVGAHLRDLYETSPSFNSAINAIANLLPAWVDGLAAAAEKMDAVIAGMAAAEAGHTEGGLTS